MSKTDRSEVRYQQNPSVSCSELDDGAILLNLNTKYYYNLNETGLRIWQSLTESSNVAEIVEKIVAEYEVERDRAIESVERILTDLKKERLVIRLLL